jgi:hypothetical protein
MQAARLKTYMLEQTLEQCELPSCVVITFQVMAVAGVSPADPHTIRTMAESRKNKLRTNPAGARHADDSKMRRVLKSAHAGKVRSAVAAPIAEKTRDFRFPIVHRSLLSGPSRAFEEKRPG